MQAREATAKAENTISTARGEAARAREESTKLRQDLAAAKEDNLKDRTTARDRIDLIERALDDARAATARTETALETSRVNEETLARQAEEAITRANEADKRTAAALTAQATLEQNVRKIREAIAAAFAKIGLGPTPPPLPSSARTSQAPQSFPPEMLDSVPPSKGSNVPAPVAVPRDSASRLPLALELDSGWSDPEPEARRPRASSPTTRRGARSHRPPTRRCRRRSTRRCTRRR